MTILFVLARPLVIILLTEKWLPMVPLLRIMCIAYMWYPIMVINNQILNVKGRSDYFLKSEIIVKIVSFAILFITVQGGLIWICLGLIIWVFSDIYIRTRYSRKIIKIGLVQQIKAVFPIFILSISFGGVVFIAYFISDLPIIQIIIGIIGGSIYFLTVSKIIKIKEFLFINKIIKTYWPILKK
jgi:O-antigen/teichoic acid export membrane protein